MDIMRINRLQQIGLGVAIGMIVGWRVFLMVCTEETCGEGSGDVILLFGEGFMIASGLLLLASMYELVFSNRKQGTNGIALLIATMLIGRIVVGLGLKK